MRLPVQQCSDLALELYVTWSSNSSTRDRSVERWRLMPDVGRRPFIELADRAIAFMSAPSEKCRCGARSSMGDRCMACASRDAE